jgi:hypothetical protein
MSMLEPLKQIMAKYRSLFGVMHVDFSFVQIVKVYNSEPTFFCSPNSFFVYVVNWYIRFFVILIKPKTLGVNFYAIEVGTTFLKFWGLLPLL